MLRSLYLLLEVDVGRAPRHRHPKFLFELPYLVWPVLGRLHLLHGRHKPRPHLHTHSFLLNHDHHLLIKARAIRKYKVSLRSPIKVFHLFLCNISLIDIELRSVFRFNQVIVLALQFLTDFMEIFQIFDANDPLKRVHQSSRQQSLAVAVAQVDKRASPFGEVGGARDPPQNNCEGSEGQLAVR